MLNKITSFLFGEFWYTRIDKHLKFKEGKMLPETENVRGFIPSGDLDLLSRCSDYFSVRVFLQEENGKAHTLARVVGEAPSQEADQYFVREDEWRELIAYSEGKFEEIESKSVIVHPNGDLALASAAYNITMNKRDPSQELESKKSPNVAKRVVIVSYKYGIKKPSRYLQRHNSSTQAQAQKYIAVTLAPTRQPAYADA